MSNTFLGLSATLYLIIGIAIVAAAASTFFTPYGKILTPMYAGVFLGGGCALFLIAVVGYVAACRKRSERSGLQGARCLLWIFTILTFLMFVLSIVAVIFMFDYEKILHGAAKVSVDETTETIGDTSTEIVKNIATQAFDGCEADVTVPSPAEPTVFQFHCNNTYFKTLTTTINSVCFAESAVNASAGSLFEKCYAGDDLLSESKWPEPANAPLPTTYPASANPPAAAVLGALRTPKGLFCACASALLEDYVLKYLNFAKYVVIGVCLFFLIVFASGIHQLCHRGCCGEPRDDALGSSERNLSQVQMQYHQHGSRKAKRGQNDDFLYRP